MCSLVYDAVHKITSSTRDLETHDPHVGTGHRPRPNQLLSGTLQIRTSSPHGPFAARDQATSAEYQFGSGSSQLGRGNAPSPHVSKMRAVPRGPELMDNTRIFIGDTKTPRTEMTVSVWRGQRFSEQR